MKSNRPINLNIFTIRFPIPAIASLLHRISGVILFLIIPFVLWGLSCSLSSSENFENIKQVLHTPFAKLMIWLMLSAFIYHFVAGVRHLLMDIGIGEGLQSGRLGVQLTLIISIILILLTGFWLW